MIQQYISIRQGGGGSVAVAVSDPSPDFGDTITITATTTGFVPTQYQFLLFNGSVTLLAQQAGNTLNWVANVAGGNYDIYVLATDGILNSYATDSITVTASYLLDVYPSAQIGYSVRKLSVLYTGSSLRVRRSSDNQEQNIGFDVNGNLDTSALTTFCTGTNGFVTTWYDQTGNGRHATQTTGSLQPKIYDSVTGVVTQNGRPTLNGMGTSRMQNFTLILASNYYISVVSRLSNLSANNMWLGNTGRNGYLFPEVGGASVNIRHDGELGGATFNVPININQYIHSFQRVVNTMNYARNGVNNTLPDTSPGRAFTINCIFDGYQNAYRISGDIQEIVIYDTNQSSNRAGIELNTNAYYNVY